MRYDACFQKPQEVPALLKKLTELSGQFESLRLMEICGTHTMAIARTGLRSLLPEHVKLISGPGCPVCVTPTEELDAALEKGFRYPGPYVIDCAIDKDEFVLPMLPPGGSMDDIIVKVGD